MPKQWSEISEDEILNFEDAHTGLMAKYERIMTRKIRDTLNALSNRISGLGDTLSKTNQFIHDEAEKIVSSNIRISRSQGRLQTVSIFLTLVIAGSTVAYTLITRQSVLTMREANRINKEFLKIEQENQLLNKAGQLPENMDQIKATISERVDRL